MMGAYPVGSLVQLDRGELAVVLRPSESRVDRPLVQLLHEGRPAGVLDLAVETSRWISAGIDPSDANIDVEAVITPPQTAA